MHFVLVLAVVYIALLVMLPEHVISITVAAGVAAWEVLSRLMIL